MDEYLIFNFIEDDNEKKLIYKIDDVNNENIAKMHFNNYHKDAIDIVVSEIEDSEIAGSEVVDLSNCYQIAAIDFSEGYTYFRKKDVKWLYEKREDIAWDRDSFGYDVIDVYNTREEGLEFLKSKKSDIGIMYNNPGISIVGTVYTGIVTNNGCFDIYDNSRFDEKSFIETFKRLNDYSLSNIKNLYYYRIGEKDLVFSLDEYGEVHYTDELHPIKDRDSTDVKLFLLNISSDDSWHKMNFDEFKDDYLDRYNKNPRKFIGCEEIFDLCDIEIDLELED